MAPPRPAKRAKRDPDATPPQRGEDDYVPGNIVEIELCNFMTYDRLVCRPGSRLNLVVGPNGSGKSSLVCAIALGLAGDPNILGRASSVGAFVKRGEVAGHVKISLRGDTPEERICITRKIDTKNKSEWLLNGTIVPKKEVIDIIRKFNIQVNNLTQFLPQDRVSEFAKLSPIQLLEETEKAVGDPDLPVQHHQLVERSKEVKALEVALKQKEHTLNSLKALNAQQEKDVERVRLRDNLLKKAELMKKKLPWLKYDKMKKEFIDIVQEQEKIAKEKMEEAARIWDDAKGPIEELKKKKATYTSNMKKIVNQVNENMTNRQKVTDQELQLNRELKATFDDIDDLKKQEKSRQHRILKAKEDLAAAEKELEDLQPYEQPRAEMEMESKNNKLLQALQSTGADNIIEAYHWVQQNKKNFRREVYGPVLLESFITQDASDRDYMVGQMKKYGIPVLNYVVNEGIRRQPLNITPEMKQLGISSRLDQAIDAPDAVKDVLISQAALDNSYIGTDETHRRADEVSKLDMRRRVLEDLSKEEDVESSTRKLVDQVAKLNAERFQAMIKLKDLLIGAVALKWSHAEKQMSSIELDAKIWEMEKGVKKFEKDANLAAREYEDRKRITHEHKMKLSMAKQHAESIAKITKDLAKEFVEMPDTVEDLEAAIQDTESEANSMLFLNQNVLQEYQNRQREIESISNKLMDDKDQYEICCSEIETVKGKWLPTLRTLVSKINDTFSRNFQEMAVAGEVSLDEHGVDFDHYGILIKVKFR
ncbi:hypothetical protein HU200_059268 [Digitaria exilis]|uniref:Structural maintenance of chromosomes protein 5 n=1 Tax=Digitaria exilis TaxID=1010633 RepID=A0A835E303_9POAL|nr:hypothetical protein HU200_059268 [Digitaria exilis]